MEVRHDIDERKDVSHDGLFHTVLSCGLRHAGVVRIEVGGHGVAF